MAESPLGARRGLHHIQFVNRAVVLNLTGGAKQHVEVIHHRTPPLLFPLLSVNSSAAHLQQCLVRSHEEKKSVATGGWR